MDVAERSTVWFAVVNVYAASKKASESWKKAEARLKADGIVYHGNRTGRSGNAMEITFDACMAGYRKFLAVGGDGTVHDVLNGIASYVEWAVSEDRKVDMSDFTLGVLPLGSGNDWIKSTGVPKNLNRAVDLLSGPVLKKQDVVRVSVLDPDDLDKTLAVSYMANIGGIGIDVFSVEPLPKNSPYYRIADKENVILTPHTAWGSYEARCRCVREMAENAKTFFAGGNRNRVD